MQQVRCIPCEYKRMLNKQKLLFLHQQGSKRANKENTDYVIYEDSETNELKLAPFEKSQERGERIIQHISRFEVFNA